MAHNPKYALDAYKALLPEQPIYDPLPYFKKDYFNQKGGTTTRKPKFIKSTSDKNEYGYPIGNKYSLNTETTSEQNLIDKENQKFLNQTAERILNKKKTFWPVTSSRSLHKDEDVFIARANNPFGHSTKLKMTYVFIIL